MQLQHGPPGQRAAAHAARGPGRAARAARPHAAQVHAAHLRRGKPLPGLFAARLLVHVVTAPTLRSDHTRLHTSAHERLVRINVLVLTVTHY